MPGWHHRCNGHELGQTPRDGEGQGGLACCSLWGHGESDMTGRLNSNNSHSLLQGIFPTQGSNPGLLPCRQILYCLKQQGSLNFLCKVR